MAPIYKVMEAYGRNFGRTRSTSKAIVETVDELEKTYQEPRAKIRKQVFAIAEKVEIELGDPFQIARQRAFHALAEEDVMAQVEAALQDISGKLEEILLEESGSESTKAWSPPTDADIENALHSWPGRPCLTIFFDQEGLLTAWGISTKVPEYDGVFVQEPIRPGFSYDTIKVMLVKALFPMFRSGNAG